MDWGGGLTQETIAVGALFDNDFVAADAGTYWYHPHNRTVEQVACGHHGALVVEAPDRADVDRDEILVPDEWLLTPNTAKIDPDCTSRHDRSHAGRAGNFIATNGQYGHSLDSGMPGFTGQVNDQEIWTILAYIKSTWPEREPAAQAAGTEASRANRGS